MIISLLAKTLINVYFMRFCGVAASNLQYISVNSVQPVYTDYSLIIHRICKPGFITSAKTVKLHSKLVSFFSLYTVLAFFINEKIDFFAYKF